MDPIEPFEYDNAAGRIAFGCGTAADLGYLVREAGGERALVVCGEHVGANRELMDPIEDGLGERYAGTFDGTTPDKSAAGAFDGVAAMDEHDADALVAVGGGSSIDLARAMRAIGAGERDADELREHAAETGRLSIPDGDLASLVAVPTTLAGADLSAGGSVTFDDEEDGDIVAGFSDPRLMPDALVYDPELFETTPEGVLFGSAMNGFDKGLELPYARHASPLTDATALRGLGLMAEALPDLPASDAMDAAVAGVVLVQYGQGNRGPGLLSVIHAFGHGLREEGVQQGIAHAVLAPPVLELLFSAVDGRRDALADALGVDGEDDDATAAAVVERVAEVRDSMDLPTELRDLDAVERDALPGVAEYIYDDATLDNGPEGFDPSVEDIEETLEDAW
ncbi:iron-containing alcohol dehydrogenase family protein [Halococcus hamelinensis]|uniref:Alcohol dehydrogenase, class IV n=1 Tax=Halococcus hamelinensis 100A6 TaxID=1132509 RepID=M0M1D1_9EURY|nr:iron-containing alcohol dehydrogenase family protein [Halococcus hamelinensis]EMA38409.1 alcohol dehydrogenase, class IV [Halococcus hamelinensis 100A6]